MGWGATVFTAAMLALGCGLYIRWRWRRSPRAYQAMIGVAGVCFAAGALLGAFVLHLAAPNYSEVATVPAAPASVNLSGRGAASPETSSPPAATSVKVVSITDGDTVDVQDQQGRTYTVRLAGIDAPEHDQVFGPEATRHLSTLIAGKTVMLECGNERSYGRMICKILLDGEDVCLDQVKAGLAWHYKQYEDEQSPADRAAYAAAECAAMKDHLGLWSDPHPAPQDFRHETSSSLLFDANGCRRSSEPSSGPVVGNARRRIFEWPGCPYNSGISPRNPVAFASPQAALAAGYQPAHNCP